MTRKEIDTLNKDAYRQTSIRLSRAEVLAQQALAAAEELGYSWGIAAAWTNLAVTAIHRGEMIAAYSSLKRAEALFLETGEQSDRGLLRIYLAFSLYYGELKQSDLSLSYSERVLELAEFLDDREYIHYGLNNKACSLFDEGKIEEALTLFERILSETDREDALSTCLSLLNIGSTLGELGRLEEALENLISGVGLARAQDLALLIPYFTHEMARIALKEDQFSQAENLFVQAFEAAEEEALGELGGEILLDWIDYLSDQGEEPAALDKILAYLDRMKPDTSLLSKVKLHEAAAELLHKQGNHPGEADHLRAALELERQLGREQRREYALYMEREGREEAHQRIALIAGVGRELTKVLGVDEVLDSLYRRVNALMPLDLLGIGVGEGEALICRYFLMHQVRLPEYSIAVENQKSLLAYSFRENREIHSGDILLDKQRYVSELHHFEYGPVKEEDKKIRSVLCLPLEYHQKRWGVLTVQSQRVNAYGPGDIDILTALGGYIVTAIENSQQADEIRRQNSLLKKQASTDDLTGLLNRREFFRRFSEIWAICLRDRTPIAVVMIDLDHFKEINDTLGHQAGDETIQKVAELLRRRFRRPLDIIGRYGGEEFIVVAGGSKERQTLKFVEELRREMESIASPPVTMSAGVFGFTPVNKDNKLMDKAVSAADEALYLAKFRGRNRVELFPRKGRDDFFP